MILFSLFGTGDVQISLIVTCLNCALYCWMGYGQGNQDQIRYMYLLCHGCDRETSCFLYVLGKRNNYGGLRKYRKSFCVHDEWRKHW